MDATTGSVAWTLVGGLVTLAIFSFLYRDNPVYRVCEAVFVGVSAGYWFVSLFWQNVWPKLILNLRDAAAATLHGAGWDGRWLYLVAGVLGVFPIGRRAPGGSGTSILNWRRNLPSPSNT